MKRKRSLRLHFAAVTRLAFVVLLVTHLMSVSTARAQGESRTIVLIGGKKSHGPAEHDFPNGVRLLQAFLTSSPDIARIAGVQVAAYPDGWPNDPGVLENASTVVWYFDGLASHPLLDARRRTQFEKLMQRGVGLVSLHQASTLLPDDTLIELPKWLGGARYGMVDRTTETVDFVPAAHPISRGVGRFSYRDEFYPTIRFISGPQGIVPILTGDLHLGSPAGQPGIRRSVAWAFERPDGGRSFGFTGLHYLASLDQSQVRTLLLNAIVWTAGIEVPDGGIRSGLPVGSVGTISLPVAATVLALMDSSSHAGTSRIDKLTFHYDAQRSGWNPRETVLTPQAVGSAAFGLQWRSPQFDAFGEKPPRLFASPLFVGEVAVRTGEHASRSFSVVYAVTTTGYVYAVNAFAASDTAAGAILWRTRLTEQPCAKGTFGNLSTPVIDLRQQRLYVTSCDETSHWRVHALDIRNGQEASGWPVPLDHVTVNASGINKNGTTQFPDKILIQRGALTLSPDKSRVYVTFGADFASGWIVAVDTTRAKVATAFATAPVTAEPQGGMWSSGGPSVDPEGRVYVATGASSAPALMGRPDFGGVFPHSAHQWGQSIIQLRDDRVRGFELTGTYTPFNYCQTAATDIDLGSSGTVVIDLDPATTSTPQLLALGGAKQGNAYLLDRAHLPGKLTQRSPCSTDPSSDLSLLPPEPQPQFGARGPINLFGPYTDRYAMVNQARSRSTAAYFRDARGKSYLFVTGSAKTGVDFTVSTPPGLARVEIVTKPGQPAYLRIDQLEQTQTFHNPGSPIVTSDGSTKAIVWVLDANASRLAPLYGPGAPRPVLYAFDALSLKLLWKSQPGDLHTSGKYNEPTAVHGTVFVGTDRIEAFGLRPKGALTLAPATWETAPVAAPSVGGDGEPAPTGIDTPALFTQRCAGCHSFGLPGIPTREKLAALPRDKIVDALTNGIMQAQALGLSTAQINALAGFLIEPLETSDAAEPASTNPPIGNVSAQRLLNADAEPGEWLSGGRDHRQSYYSPLIDIHKGNIGKLGYAWSHETEFTGGMEATPIVVDGAMFTSGNKGTVYALDAATGASRWTFIPRIDSDVVRKLCCGQVNRGVAVWKGRVYVGSIDGYLYALDAATGAVIWKLDTITDRARAYSITGAPYIAEDLVVIGNSGADFDARGYITAYHQETGKQAWRFFTVPGNPKKGFEHPELEIAAKTWDPNSSWESGLGGTAWDGMAYDPFLKLLYVGTGNGTPWMRQRRSPAGGDNLFLSSILALDASTGRLVWHYQTTPADNWDYTATAKMILAELPIKGRPRQVIMQAPKNGFFYVLDRKSGELLSAKPFAKVTWATRVDLKTGRPMETGQGDYFDEPKLIFPGAWGGHSWPPMAHNPRTGLVYLPVLELPMVFAKSQTSMARHAPITAAGRIPERMIEELPPIEKLGAGQPDYRSRAMLKAWDPLKQRVVWEVDTTSDRNGPVWIADGGGVMTTAGGLVFQGRKTGQLVALDAETGAQLHSVDVGNSMVAAPMTYRVGETQYIAIMAEGDLTKRLSGRIVAFKLSGRAVPRQSMIDSAKGAIVAPPVANTGTPDQISSGKQLFERHCTVCHAAANRAPDLATISAQTHADFMDIVLKGRRADKGMGNFSAVLSTSEANAIHAYLTHLAWDRYRKSQDSNPRTHDNR